VRRPIRHLFLFIGAEPNTNWLSGSGVALDAKGFVLTGGACDSDRHPLETSRRGVFAIGDVRSGSVKRVAAAVGEGAQVVATLHAFLYHRSQMLTHHVRPRSGIEVPICESNQRCAWPAMKPG
jgi:thioredoxin reductase (NADPH)